MEETKSCVGFAIDCGTLFKGAGVTVGGLILFVASVYVLLAAIFGRYMGYLVLAITFAGWMVLQSSMWLFGFWAQGPDTPTNLGPRGADPAWRVIAAGATAGADRYDVYGLYPDAPWVSPQPSDPAFSADLQSAQGAATTFLATEANHELGLAHDDLAAITSAQFTIDATSFATSEDGTKVGVVRAHFNGGGPVTTVSLYFDSGSVPRYSYMFLGGSIVLFAIHLPLLDRAERRRKEFLTGGGATPWYGPA